MIGVKPELAPSSLLHFEMTMPIVRRLLDRSRRFREEGNWAQTERCAQDALEFCKESEDYIGLALTQLHLVDFLSEIGEIGQALRLCTGAYETLCHQPSSVQRHNEAVATYTHGLLHQLQLFGSPMRTLWWYQEALKRFKAAREYWDERIEELKQLEEEKARWNAPVDKAQATKSEAEEKNAKKEAEEKAAENEAEEKKRAWQEYKTNLRKLLIIHFDREELKTLCVDLGVDYETFSDKGKEYCARDLIRYLDRRSGIPRLVKLCKEQRPAQPWEEMPQASKEATTRETPPPIQSIPLTQMESYSKDCATVCAWLKRRSEQIMRRRTSQNAWQPSVDVWPTDSKDTPFPEDRGRRGHILGDDRIRIFKTNYRLDTPISPYKDHYCFALPVRRGRLAAPGSRPDGYILVCQRWQVDEQVQQTKPGVVWEHGEGWLAVDFKRGPDGTIKFHPRPPVIIGGTGGNNDPAGKIKGYVIALLRPEKRTP